MTAAVKHQQLLCKCIQW